MRPNYYALLSRCVEEGARMGVNRAHKHVEHPDIDSIVEHVELAVMNNICEYFNFHEEEK